MIALLVAAFAVAAPQVQAPAIRTTLDTAVVTVGDQLHLTVSVTHGQSERVHWPDSLALAPFEVIDRDTASLATAADRVTSTMRLTLTAFQLGDLDLPSFPVVVEAARGADTLTTDGWKVTVKSIGLAQDTDIRDVKGPLSIPRNWWLLAPWVVGAIALAVAGVWLYRRYRRRATPTPAVRPDPRFPPHWIAHQALDDLERSDLLHRGQVKEYYDQASDIIRRYFEARYHVTALEMATVEVMEGLEQVNMDAETLTDVRRFLETCDLVKFAKMIPAAEDCRELIPAARRIVDATKVVPPPIVSSAGNGRTVGTAGTAGSAGSAGSAGGERAEEAG
jgi:hypothetical protein